MTEQVNQSSGAITTQGTIKSDNEPKNKRRWLKAVIWIFAALLLLFLIFISLPYVLSAFWGNDSPPPNDQDLMLSQVNILMNENSYFDLLKFSSVQNVDGELEKPEIMIEILAGKNDMDYLESINWEIDGTKELLNKNQEALGIYTEAAKKSQFQYDFTKDPAIIGLDMPIVGLNTWRQISRISAIKAIYLMRQHDDQAAFDEAMKSVIIGHNIERSKNVPLITYLVALVSN